MYKTGLRPGPFLHSTQQLGSVMEEEEIRENFMRSVNEKDSKNPVSLMNLLPGGNKKATKLSEVTEFSSIPAADKAFKSCLKGITEKLSLILIRAAVTNEGGLSEESYGALTLVKFGKGFYCISIGSEGLKLRDPMVIKEILESKSCKDLSSLCSLKNQELTAQLFRNNNIKKEVNVGDEKTRNKSETNEKRKYKKSKKQEEKEAMGNARKMRNKKNKTNADTQPENVEKDIHANNSDIENGEFQKNWDSYISEKEQEKSNENLNDDAENSANENYGLNKKIFKNIPKEPSCENLKKLVPTKRNLLQETNQERNDVKKLKIIKVNIEPSHPSFLSPRKYMLEEERLIKGSLHVAQDRKSDTVNMNVPYRRYYTEEIPKCFQCSTEITYMSSALSCTYCNNKTHLQCVDNYSSIESFVCSKCLDSIFAHVQNDDSIGDSTLENHDSEEIEQDELLFNNQLCSESLDLQDKKEEQNTQEIREASQQKFDKLELLLKELNMSHLLSLFRKEKVDIDILKKMSHSDLQMLRIETFGDRYRIIDKVKDSFS